VYRNLTFLEDEVSQSLYRGFAPGVTGQFRLPHPLRDPLSKIPGSALLLQWWHARPPDPRAGTTPPRFSRLEPPLAQSHKFTAMQTPKWPVMCRTGSSTLLAYSPADRHDSWDS